MRPSLHNLIGAGVHRRRREDEHTLSTDAVTSLNQTGAFAMTLPSTIDFAGMIERLDNGTRRWFHAMIRASREATLERPGAGFDADRLRNERPVFDRLNELVRESLLSHFDPSTEAGRFALTDSTKRREVATTVASQYGCVHYLLWLVSRAKQGNSSMALSHIQQAWTDTGFGLWANLVPEEGLLACMSAAHMLQQQLGLRSQMPAHFPHVIHKPYNSSLLKTHHDQMPVMQLMQNLQAHVQSDDPSTLAWVKTHGLQMLAHVVGGRHTPDVASGATYIIGPMTPARLLLVLTELYSNAQAYRISPDFWGKNGGPYFLPYENHLPALNLMLKQHEGADAPELRRIPLQTAASSGGSTLVGWPVGWLHGSYASKQARRVTLIIPLDVRVTLVPNFAKQQDSLQWLNDLAVISSIEFTTETEQAQLAQANHRIVHRRETFADGATHRQPSIASVLMRSREAAALMHTTPGWWFNIGPKRATVQQMKNMFLPEVAPAQAVEPDAPYAANFALVPPADPDNPHNAGPSDPFRFEDTEEMEEAAQEPPERLPRPWPFAIVPSVILTAEDRPPVVPSMPLYNNMEQPMVPEPMVQPTIQSTIQPPYDPLSDRQLDIVHRLANVEGLRCLNVRQPWASLLVEGVKSVENRGLNVNQPRFATYSNIGDDLRGEWVLIVASTARPTQAVLVQALQDFQLIYGNNAGRQQYDQFMQRHQGRWILGSIVGVVRFNDILTADRVQSPSYVQTLTPGALGWYHGAPDVGWHIRAEDALAFNRPIPNIKGVLSISRIVSKGPVVERRIRDALRDMQ